MASLDFDQRRAERGAAEGHVVVLGGVRHELPAVLSLSAMARVGAAISDASGGDLRMDAIDAGAMLRAAPALVDAFADEFGGWVRGLDETEFMAIFELYELGGAAAGEASGS